MPSKAIPEFGVNSQMHLDNLRELIARAAKHGLRVYLYMQPPRGFEWNDPIWEAHPELKGASMNWETKEADPTTYYAMCSSMPAVKKFLRESPEKLFRALPKLGGLILITASEYPSHCWRSGASGLNAEGAPIEGGSHCPRCHERTPAEVVGEILQLVHDGMRAASPTAQLIAWNWSWSFFDADPSPNVIKAVPDDAILMVDFERGDSREILGKVRQLDEYSLAFAGPSQRFLGTYKIAKKRGLPVIAKLQLGTTHELATVPNLPLLGNLYEKAAQLRKLKVEGFMGCWNFGNMISANTAGFMRFFDAPKLPPRERALQEFARDYFPGCDAELTAQAWETFGAAMLNYPFSIPFIYMGPMNFSLSYPVKSGPLGKVSAGRSWMDDKVRGDDLSACLDPYTVPEIIRGFNLLTRQWKTGVAQLEKSLSNATGENARRELDNAKVCYHIFRSTWNTFRIYKLRQTWTAEKRADFNKIITDELENLRAVLPLVKADVRFGYHGEAHAHFFDAASITKKIKSLQRQLTKTS